MFPGVKLRGPVLMADPERVVDDAGACAAIRPALLVDACIVIVLPFGTTLVCPVELGSRAASTVDPGRVVDGVVPAVCA